MKIHSSAIRPPSSDLRRWVALVVVCLGQLMIVLDSTIVNVALPAIQRDLHFTQADLTWIVNAYLITFGSFLLVASGSTVITGWTVTHANIHYCSSSLWQVSNGSRNIDLDGAANNPIDFFL